MNLLLYLRQVYNLIQVFYGRIEDVKDGGRLHLTYCYITVKLGDAVQLIVSSIIISLFPSPCGGVFLKFFYVFIYFFYKPFVDS